MARNVAATNAGVGAASVSTRVKLTLQAVKKCVLFGALPMFVLPMAVWLSLVSPQGFDIVKIHLLSKFVYSDVPHKWRLRDESGERKIVTVKASDGAPVQYMTPEQIHKVLKPIWNPADVFDLVFLASLVSSVFGYIALWRIFAKRGLDQQTNKRIRGASVLVSAKKLDGLVRAKDPSDYTLVDVALPRSSPMQGILAIGAQGSGKSLAIHDFMRQAFAKKRKCIIYDQSGEFYRAYFRPGLDLFFNPACLGSIPWSIFQELQYTYDANTLAQAFLPPKALSGQAGANSFFEDAARAVFSVILLRLAQRGAVNTKDIATAFLEMPADEMNALIQKSVASSAIGGDSKAQRQGVISSISIYLDGIAAANEGSWSIREFLDQEGDGRLFLFGTEDTKAMFSPLYRLILSVAFSAIAAKQEIVHEDRYWFFLDEIHTLGDIKVDEQLATLRKFGVCVFAGTQNDSQFITSVGKDRAESAMNGFNTLLQLRLNETNAKKRAAERLGKLEMETISQNQAVAVVEQRDGAGIVINEQEKWLVMPATIGELANCHGYLKLSGDFPAALVNYDDWVPKKKGQRTRSDKFAPRQPSPPRDPRFIITRKDLPGGTTAFDDVRHEVEQEKAAEAVRVSSAKAQQQASLMLVGASTIVTEMPGTPAGISNPPQENIPGLSIDDEEHQLPSTS